jgi:hypothetical protein
VIPTPIVHHFLSDFMANGRFTGFPALGIQWQRIESEALRKAYKMCPKQKGKQDAVMLRVSGMQLSPLPAAHC